MLIGLGGLLGLAQDGRCEVEVHEALSIKELISVKHRFEAYRMSPDVGLSLNAKELAMLIEEEGSTPLFVDFEGDQVTGSVALPARWGRCWPVRFHGTLRIEEGVVSVVVDSLAVGSLPLSMLFGGRTLKLRQEKMPSRRTARFLEQTHHAHVEDSKLDVHLRAPESFRWE